jgi:membrane-bound lytic murein transglycosylase D
MAQDWFLALASYNAGEGNVRSALRKNQRRGKATDFFSLSTLPRETTAYVPRLLAISAIVANPDRYGVKLQPISNQPAWQIVDIGSQLDIAKAAELIGIDSKQIYRLNPGLNQWATPPDGPHRLLVSNDHADRFVAAIATLPSHERVAWQRHVIQSGETLGTLAQQYRTTVTSIRSANSIRGSMIRQGDSLLIPVASGQQDKYSLSQTARLQTSQDRYRERYQTAPLQHEIVRGDTLWDLSMKYGVSVRDLGRWNGLAARDTLKPGRELLVFNPSVASSAPKLASGQASVSPVVSGHRLAAPGLRPASNDIIRKVSYRVRSGESLASIASKFRLSVNRIRQWNRDLADQKYIHPGDRLTLYVDVTRVQ